MLDILINSPDNSDDFHLDIPTCKSGKSDDWQEKDTTENDVCIVKCPGDDDPDEEITTANDNCYTIKIYCDSSDDSDNWQANNTAETDACIVTCSGDDEPIEANIGNKFAYENESDYASDYIYGEKSLLKDLNDSAESEYESDEKYGGYDIYSEQSLLKDLVINDTGSSKNRISSDWLEEKFAKKENATNWDDDLDCDAKKISKKAKKLRKQKKRLEKAMLKFCDDNNADLSDEIEMAAESDKRSSGLTKLTPYLLVEKMMENYNIVIVDGIIHIHDGSIYRAYFNNADVHTPIQKILTREEKIPLRTTNYNDAVTQLYAQEELIWDNPPISDEIIAFNNGVFNFVKNTKIKKPEKHFLNFKINAKFIPDGDLSSPHFDKFIYDITGGNKQAMRLIYYFIGGCIIPGNYAKSFFVLGTAPNTGKSILGRFLSELIDDEQVSSVPLHNLKSDFHLARLKNKVMNISMDLDSTTISNTAVSYLKAITGNDKIDINPKYDKMTVMKRHGKLIFGTNHPIHLSQIDEAFWQRLVLIPLMCSVPKEHQDVHLDEKILKERDAIVTKALFCARELVKEYKFPKCDLAERMIENWRFGDSASITLFIKENCKIGDTDTSTHSQVLYAEYLKFCKLNNFEPTNGNDFSRHLTKYFNLSRKKWTNDDGQYLWGFRGIELVE